jgi:hypothetical protein
MVKKFDAVAFQRKARAKMSEHYLEDREGFLLELKRAGKRIRREH